MQIVMTKKRATVIHAMLTRSLARANNPDKEIVAFNNQLRRALTPKNPASRNNAGYAQSAARRTRRGKK